MLFSAVFKAKARAALKGHWQTALLIALVVNLPSLLIQGLSSFTGNDWSAQLQTVLLEASDSTQITASVLYKQITGIFQDPGVQLMIGLSALAWIITPCLSLGMNHWAMERLRGVVMPVSTVFSRLNLFLKGIGLRLLITLKVLLWMLPGMAISVGAPLLMLQDLRYKTQAELYSLAQTIEILLWAGILVMLVMGIYGYLRYVLADLILADEPAERVLSCARRSMQMMNGRKGGMLALLLSFALWYLLILIVTAMLAGIAGTIIALMLQMLGSLALGVYVLLSECAFYEALRQQPAPIVVNEV